MTRTVSLAVLLTALLLPVVGQSAEVLARAPSPSLGPRGVVAAQLDCLKGATDDDLARAFLFSSPVGQAVIGPLPRFRFVMRRGYPELLGHRGAIYGDTVINGDEAAQAVEVIARNGQVYRYVFRLSLQHEGEYSGCWLTDSLVSAPAPAAQEI